jgi:hypothetical protein
VLTANEIVDGINNGAYPYFFRQRVSADPFVMKVSPLVFPPEMLNENDYNLVMGCVLSHRDSWFDMKIGGSMPSDQSGDGGIGLAVISMDVTKIGNISVNKDQIMPSGTSRSISGKIKLQSGSVLTFSIGFAGCYDGKDESILKILAKQIKVNMLLENAKAFMVMLKEKNPSMYDEAKLEFVMTFGSECWTTTFEHADDPAF